MMYENMSASEDRLVMKIEFEDKLSTLVMDREE